MNIIKISAVLTAALLTGALSATAFAAETLTTTTASITFRKAIDVTNAAGAGGITGTIAFDVTAADEAGSHDAATAIMTTDTHPKEIALEFAVGGKAVRIGAIAKLSLIHI